MGLGPAPDYEIRLRGHRAALFLFLVCPSAEPTYISDYSRLMDFLEFDEARLAVSRHLGLELSREQYEMPLWRLLDQLGERF